MNGAPARLGERLPYIPDRPALIQLAFRLEWLTVAWMVIEALVAIGSGLIAGSLMLTAFGLDSVVELICGRPHLAPEARIAAWQGILPAR